MLVALRLAQVQSLLERDLSMVKLQSEVKRPEPQKRSEDVAHSPTFANERGKVEEKVVKEQKQKILMAGKPGMKFSPKAL